MSTSADASPRIRVWLLDPPPDRTSYQLQWRDPATQRRCTRSAGTSDPDRAEDARADLEYKLNNGVAIDSAKRPGPVSWADFRKRFLAEHGATMRPRSVEKLGTVLDCVEQILAPRTVASIDDAAMRKFHLGMLERKLRGGKVGMSAHTRERYLGILRSAIAWGKEAGLAASVPDKPRVKVPRKRPMPVPAAEVDKFLEAAPSPEWKLFFQLALWAGLRLSEALHARWSRSDSHPWVDLAEKRIWLPHAFVKGAEDQWVPLHPALAEGLAALPREHGDRVFLFTSRGTRSHGREITRGGLSQTVSRMAKRAGVRVSMQALRRTFGCRLAGKVPAAVLQRLLRHASITTTMGFYASADDGSLRDAIEGLE